MKKQKFPIDQIISGECVKVLNSLPEKSVDLIFADPPYNLQLQNTLWRPNMTKVDAVNDKWDQFADFQSYDDFTIGWLQACRRVLKDNGAIWVIGSYHNIFRIGKIMQDIGFWILNDVVWIKTNPMPNFRGVRFANAHETLLWASITKGSRYTFNHSAMKGLDDDEKQMRSDWLLSISDFWEEAICSGSERIKVNGKKAHSTQKPEALLYRVILSSTKPGDVVLDPFLGSGTTCVVAKKLHRHWIGIEKEKKYISVAQKRIKNTSPIRLEPEIITEVFDVRDKKRIALRVNFGSLLEAGMLTPGGRLYFREQPSLFAYIKPDGRLRLPNGFEGSIHQVGKSLMNGNPCTGWQNWYFLSKENKMIVIDELREIFRKRALSIKL
jgi:site-specific DNA-methyltransferase (adenine-specific)